MQSPSCSLITQTVRNTTKWGIVASPQDTNKQDKAEKVKGERKNCLRLAAN
jgi:hypothetical protein